MEGEHPVGGWEPWSFAGVADLAQKARSRPKVGQGQSTRRAARTPIMPSAGPRLHSERRGALRQNDACRIMPSFSLAISYANRQ